MKVRERMIQIKRYLEIEAVEKQIRQKQEQIKLKQDQKKKQDHAIILARLKQKHEAQLVQLKDEKQRELDIMLTKRERDFVVDNLKLLNQRANLEEVFGKQIAYQK